MFFSSKHCSTRFALVILQLQVNGTDVSLVALLPGKLHAAVLAMVLLLAQMHGTLNLALLKKPLKFIWLLCRVFFGESSNVLF
jgi:hypothetical protein